MIGTLIIGAGPAGLACAAALKMRGEDAVILEKDNAVGTVWRNHYDRLHLNSARRYSGLPGLAMPKSYPRYPSRDQLVAYLEGYAQYYQISPVFGAEVREIKRDACWEVATQNAVFRAHNVILATGVASFPKRADWPGLREFPGAVLHSSDYRNARAFAGKRVLVVGFGNSGGEIALDLAEAGVEAVLSVRSPVNVIPRDILGIPAQSFAIIERHLPSRLVDLVNGPIARLRTGDISNLGLTKASKGPTTQIIENKRIPLIDIGTLSCIRDGSVAVRGAIERVNQSMVHFTNGEPVQFDAIIQATGYKPDLRSILPDAGSVLDGNGQPTASGKISGQDGLWFCGYKVVPTGHLREIRLEAEAIAAEIPAR